MPAAKKEWPVAEVQIPYPVLVCDVGGTNVRFALVQEPGGVLQALPSARTADHPGLAEAASAALGAQKVRSALVCAAGPCEGRRLRLTNAPWVIEGPQVAAALSLSQGLLFNDFEGLALSLPRVQPDGVRFIGEPQAGDAGPMLVTGPGTGLGTAALLRVEGKWRAIACEAAHSDFAPVTGEERAFWPFVEPSFGRITPETLISGPGLRRLHRARLAARGAPRPDLDAAGVTARALADPAGEEAASVRSFWSLAARFAGDMAVTFVATGGVTLAGGVLPRLLPLLDQAAFRASFENKAPYDWLARRIPVRLLIEQETVLRGLAAIAAHPEAYAIDYAERAWC
jgi:glucokinase